MRIFKGSIPIGMSLGVMAAVTALLWHLKVTTTGSDHLVFLYLMPVVLIAVFYTGRLAILCAALAVILGDYYLQDPLYSLANDNPLEYVDLVVFAGLAAMAIKCVRGFLQPRTKVPDFRIALQGLVNCYAITGLITDLEADRRRF